ncbi:MAG: transcription antitermination factor NusB, partial [Candidatus Cloacimonadaceae bacterium]
MAKNIRHEAYDIIVKVLKNNDFSDNLLQKKANTLRHQGIEHIDFLYQLVKGTVKYKLHLDYIIRLHTDQAKYEKTDLKIKVLLYLGLYQLLYMKSVPDHAAVNETVELAKSVFGEAVAGFVNSVLRSYQRKPEIKYPEDNIQRIAYEYSYPIELIEDWIKLWGGDRTELVAMFFNEPSKLHLRVNTAATNSDKLLHYFTKRNVTCSMSSASKNMLVCQDALAALEDVAFSEGYFTIQDASAAMIVELLDPQLNESIPDLFSVPGGKCTYITEKLQNTGEVIAVDKS